MKRDRAAVLARLAAWERFREEQSRQQLAVTHAAEEEARQARLRDECALLAVEQAREVAMRHPQADIARYALYAACVESAFVMLDSSHAAWQGAQEDVERATLYWTLTRDRRDMANDRAEEARRDVQRAIGQKAMADLMDLWLARRNS